MPPRKGRSSRKGPNKPKTSRLPIPKSPETDTSNTPVMARPPPNTPLVPGSGGLPGTVEVDFAKELQNKGLGETVEEEEEVEEKVEGKLGEEVGKEVEEEVPSQKQSAEGSPVTPRTKQRTLEEELAEAMGEVVGFELDSDVEDFSASPTWPVAGDQVNVPPEPGTEENEFVKFLDENTNINLASSTNTNLRNLEKFKEIGRKIVAVHAANATEESPERPSRYKGPRPGEETLVITTPNWTGEVPVRFPSLQISPKTIPDPKRFAKAGRRTPGVVPATPGKSPKRVSFHKDAKEPGKLHEPIEPINDGEERPSPLISIPEDIISTDKRSSYDPTLAPPPLSFRPRQPDIPPPQQRQSYDPGLAPRPLLFRPTQPNYHADFTTPSPVTGGLRPPPAKSTSEKGSESTVFHTANLGPATLPIQETPTRGGHHHPPTQTKPQGTSGSASTWSIGRYTNTPPSGLLVEVLAGSSPESTYSGRPRTAGSTNPSIRNPDQGPQLIFPQPSGTFGIPNRVNPGTNPSPGFQPRLPRPIVVPTGPTPVIPGAFIETAPADTIYNRLPRNYSSPDYVTESQQPGPNPFGSPLPPVLGAQPTPQNTSTSPLILPRPKDASRVPIRGPRVASRSACQDKGTPSPPAFLPIHNPPSKIHPDIWPPTTTNTILDPNNRASTIGNVRRQEDTIRTPDDVRIAREREMIRRDEAEERQRAVQENIQKRNEERRKKGLRTTTGGGGGDPGGDSSDSGDDAGDKGGGGAGGVGGSGGDKSPEGAKPPLPPWPTEGGDDSGGGSREPVNDNPPPPSGGGNNGDGGESPPADDNPPPPPESGGDNSGGGSGAPPPPPAPPPPGGDGDDGNGSDQGNNVENPDNGAGDGIADAPEQAEQAEPHFDTWEDVCRWRLYRDRGGNMYGGDQGTLLGFRRITELQNQIDQLQAEVEGLDSRLLVEMNGNINLMSQLYEYRDQNRRLDQLQQGYQQQFRTYDEQLEDAKKNSRNDHAWKELEDENARLKIQRMDAEEKLEETKKGIKDTKDETDKRIAEVREQMRADAEHVNNFLKERLEEAGKRIDAHADTIRKQRQKFQEGIKDRDDRKTFQAQETEIRTLKEQLQDSEKEIKRLEKKIDESPLGEEQEAHNETRRQLRDAEERLEEADRAIQENEDLKKENSRLLAEAANKLTTAQCDERHRTVYWELKDTKERLEELTNDKEAVKKYAEVEAERDDYHRRWWAMVLGTRANLSPMEQYNTFVKDKSNEEEIKRLREENEKLKSQLDSQLGTHETPNTDTLKPFQDQNNTLKAQLESLQQSSQGKITEAECSERNQGLQEQNHQQRDLLSEIQKKYERLAKFISDITFGAGTVPVDYRGLFNQRNHLSRELKKFQEDEKKATEKLSKEHEGVLEDLLKGTMENNSRLTKALEEIREQKVQRDRCINKLIQAAKAKGIRLRDPRSINQIMEDQEANSLQLGEDNAENGNVLVEMGVLEPTQPADAPSPSTTDVPPPSEEDVPPPPKDGSPPSKNATPPPPGATDPGCPAKLQKAEKTIQELKEANTILQDEIKASATVVPLPKSPKSPGDPDCPTQLRKAEETIQTRDETIAEQTTEIDRLKTNNRKVRDDLNALQKRLRENRTACREEKVALDSQINSLNEQLKTAHDTIAQKTEDLESAEEIRTQTATQIQEDQDQIQKLTSQLDAVKAGSKEQAQKIIHLETQIPKQRDDCNAEKRKRDEDINRLKGENIRMKQAVDEANKLRGQLQAIQDRPAPDTPLTPEQSATRIQELEGWNANLQGQLRMQGLRLHHLQHVEAQVRDLQASNQNATNVYWTLAEHTMRAEQELRQLRDELNITPERRAYIDRQIEPIMEEGRQTRQQYHDAYAYLQRQYNNLNQRYAILLAQLPENDLRKNISEWAEANTKQKEELMALKKKQQTNVPAAMILEFKNQIANLERTLEEVKQSNRSFRTQNSTLQVDSGRAKERVTKLELENRRQEEDIIRLSLRPPLETFNELKEELKTANELWEKDLDTAQKAIDYLNKEIETLNKALDAYEKALRNYVDAATSPILSAGEVKKIESEVANLMASLNKAKTDLETQLKSQEEECKKNLDELQTKITSLEKENNDLKKSPGQTVPHVPAPAPAPTLTYAPIHTILDEPPSEDASELTSLITSLQTQIETLTWAQLILSTPGASPSPSPVSLADITRIQQSHAEFQTLLNDFLSKLDPSFSPSSQNSPITTKQLIEHLTKKLNELTPRRNKLNTFIMLGRKSLPGTTSSPLPGGATPARQIAEQAKKAAEALAAQRVELIEVEIESKALEDRIEELKNPKTCEQKLANLQTDFNSIKTELKDLKTKIAGATERYRKLKEDQNAAVGRKRELERKRGARRPRFSGPRRLRAVSTTTTPLSAEEQAAVDAELETIDTQLDEKGQEIESLEILLPHLPILEEPEKENDELKNKISGFENASPCEQRLAALQKEFDGFKKAKEEEEEGAEGDDELTVVINEDKKCQESLTALQERFNAVQTENEELKKKLPDSSAAPVTSTTPPGSSPLPSLRRPQSTDLANLRARITILEGERDALQLQVNNRPRLFRETLQSLRGRLNAATKRERTLQMLIDNGSASDYVRQQIRELTDEYVERGLRVKELERDVEHANAEANRYLDEMRDLEFLHREEESARKQAERDSLDRPADIRIKDLEKELKEARKKRDGDAAEQLHSQEEEIKRLKAENDAKEAIIRNHHQTKTIEIEVLELKDALKKCFAVGANPVLWERYKVLERQVAEADIYKASSIKEIEDARTARRAAQNWLDQANARIVNLVDQIANREITPGSPLARELETLRQEGEARIQRHRRAIADIEATLNVANDTIEEMSRKLDNQTQSDTNLAQQLEDCQAHGKELTKTNTNLLSRLENLQKELDSAQNQVQALQSPDANAELTTQLTTARQDVANLQQQLTDAQTEWDEARGQVTTASGAIESLQGQLAQAQGEATQAQQQRSELETSHQATISDLESQLETHRILIADVRSELTSTDEKFKKSQSRLAANEKELATVNERAKLAIEAERRVLAGDREGASQIFVKQLEAAQKEREETEQRGTAALEDARRTHRTELDAQRNARELGEKRIKELEEDNKKLGDEIARLKGGISEGPAPAPDVPIDATGPAQESRIGELEAENQRLREENGRIRQLEEDIVALADEIKRLRGISGEAPDVHPEGGGGGGDDGGGGGGGGGAPGGGGGGGPPQPSPQSLACSFGKKYYQLTHAIEFIFGSRSTLGMTNRDTEEPLEMATELLALANRIGRERHIIQARLALGIVQILREDVANALDNLTAVDAQREHIFHENLPVLEKALEAARNGGRGIQSRETYRNKYQTAAMLRRQAPQPNAWRR